MDLAVYMCSIREKFKEYDTVILYIDNITSHASGSIQQEHDNERLRVILNEYLEQPHLIDPYLSEFITKLLKLVKQSDLIPTAFHQTFKFLYMFIKVRGFKNVIRHFPHEVADLEFVLQLLNNQNVEEHSCWETRYVLLLWLAMVCMIPFDLRKLDGLKGDKEPIMDRILEAVQPYFLVTDKCRDAASYLVAKFLTRPDVNSIKLAPFISESCKDLETVDSGNMNGMIQKAGLLTRLALIFKHGRRDDLLPFASTVLSCVVKLKLLDTDNSYMRKLAVKLIQRLGLTFLVPRVASWRYFRGNRSLADNLSSVSKSALSESTSVVSKELKDEDDEFDIEEEVETVLEFLITGLKDKDTIVRWSAAKGVGRITGRLPRELADEVVGSLLELFDYSELDGAWHGGCLALAELGRRGLLLPTRLKEVVPIILKALTYDERRGSYSVGSHVRDAACYVCWSFARAYEPQQIKPYVLDIARSLLITTLFDREINCRRAASAAFQENVGRQGTFPHGIDILTAADYFAVGNRYNCFTDLSLFVGGFKEYTHALIDHLVTVKISHWDSAMREVTSTALANLTLLDPAYMENHVLPSLAKSASSLDICTKHGAILSMAEIIYALHVVNGESMHLDDSVLNTIKSLVSELRVNKRFKGFGGELMRKAVCKLIEKLSQVEIQIDDFTVLDDWLFVLEDTIPHTEPLVQEHAIIALPYFCMKYLKSSTHFKTYEILQRILRKLESHIKFDRMGFAQAVGVLPKFMLEEHVTEVIKSLIKCTVVEENSANAGLYAEARKYAVAALLSIVKTMSLCNSCISERINDIFDTMFRCMHDYSMDSRGDVGAWVREAAMKSLVELAFYTVDENRSDLLTEKICNQILCCLLQQVAEKIDRTRHIASNLLFDYLYHSPPIPHIAQREFIEEMIPRYLIGTVDLTTPYFVFGLIKELLPLREYQYSLLLGFTVSVGGLTESLVRSSSDCLLEFLMKYQESKEAMAQICDNIIKIMTAYSKNTRIIIPMFKVLDLLISSGCFQIYDDVDKSSLFPTQLVTCLKTEIKGSGDAKKLLASINVFCGLLQFPQGVRHTCLQQLLLFLCHKYPRIRCATAEQLYTTLVTFDDIIPTVHQQHVLVKLMEVPWADGLQSLRPIRNELCVLLNIPIPKLKNASATVTEAQRPRIDELDSYKDLVSREHGY